jgi:hypothetical protein
MSCFIVSDFHINVIVAFADKANCLPCAPELAAALLAEANAVAFLSRYEEQGPELPDVPAFEYSVEDLTDICPVQIFKACNCLSYQCSDAEDWSDSEACAILKAIEGAAATASGAKDPRQTEAYELAMWAL